MAELVKEGKFDYIGLSECSAETLKRANTVRLRLHAPEPGYDVVYTFGQVHPIAAVEIEVSPWSYEEETKRGEWTFRRLLPRPYLYPPRLVIATAKDLGVAVVAYAPLGRGFLTGRIKSRADLGEDDLRLQYDRFSEEVRRWMPV